MVISSKGTKNRPLSVSETLLQLYLAPKSLKH